MVRLQGALSVTPKATPHGPQLKPSGHQTNMLTAATQFLQEGANEKDHGETKGQMEKDVKGSNPAQAQIKAV